MGCCRYPCAPLNRRHLPIDVPRCPALQAPQQTGDAWCTDLHFKNYLGRRDHRRAASKWFVARCDEVISRASSGIVFCTISVRGSTNRKSSMRSPAMPDGSWGCCSSRN